jgi:hypothetical protein
MKKDRACPRYHRHAQMLRDEVAREKQHYTAKRACRETLLANLKRSSGETSSSAIKAKGKKRAHDDSDDSDDSETPPTKSRKSKAAWPAKVSKTAQPAKASTNQRVVNVNDINDLRLAMAHTTVTAKQITEHRAAQGVCMVLHGFSAHRLTLARLDHSRTGGSDCQGPQRALHGVRGHHALGGRGF